MAATGRNEPPKLQKIADDMRKRITNGEFRPGDRLPGEKVLAEQYGVSVRTPRSAMLVLAAEGLVEKRHGSGTYVKGARPLLGVSASYVTPPPGGGWTWAQEARRHGMEGTQTLGPVKEAPAPPQVAEALALPEDAPVVVRPRVLLLDGKPVQLATSYYPAGIARGTGLAEQKCNRGGSCTVLAAVGFPPVDFTETVTARMPSKEEVRQLELAAGVPVLHVFRTVMSEGPRPVEVLDMVAAADRIKLMYQMPVSV